MGKEAVHHSVQTRLSDCPSPETQPHICWESSMVYRPPLTTQGRKSKGQCASMLTVLDSQNLKTGSSRDSGINPKPLKSNNKKKAEAEQCTQFASLISNNQSEPVSPHHSTLQSAISDQSCLAGQTAQPSSSFLMCFWE